MQIALLAGGLCASPAAFSQEAAPADASTVRIAYLTQEVEHPPALSNLDDPPADEGLAGARLAVADNNSTGRFLKQGFALEAVTVPIDGDPAQALRDLAAAGHRIVVLDLPGETPGALARLPEAANLLLFNAGSTDDSLRNALCAPNLLHTAPDRAMLADALAQYLAVKRWTKWLLIVGTRPEDRLYAAAVKRAAKRFGAEVVEEKTWSEDHDARRTAQAEMPVFTQGKRHDVVIVADEIGDFGDYVLYRTWEPRPVAGTQGLVPTNWHRAHEAWGAAQLQSRFKAAAQRVMSPRDHAVWTAIRAVGEAATRTRSTDPAALAAYIRGPDFTLAAFKGVPLSFRSWDGQLRQPVLLAADRSLVSVSPQDGFLHPRTELDTLGHDQPETGCRR
ncbi:ABC transporter substrate-binding protein [Azospirillum formosense]|uniref:ABC transporter substrate-binding protein n=1 Tax=Azospirillum formosense TaxID=861533 RepID=A0ABX2L2L8_9PROT|nr:ABC transporter substrate-binding protein [Azospirillum formosense]NUB22249.1 ABC transporter substrate-binding protein [Azospirillum formosense]